MSLVTNYTRCICWNCLILTFFIPLECRHCLQKTWLNRLPVIMYKRVSFTQQVWHYKYKKIQNFPLATHKRNTRCIHPILYRLIATAMNFRNYSYIAQQWTSSERSMGIMSILNIRSNKQRKQHAYSDIVFKWHNFMSTQVVPVAVMSGRFLKVAVNWGMVTSDMMAFTLWNITLELKQSSIGDSSDQFTHREGLQTWTKCLHFTSWEVHGQQTKCQAVQWCEL